MNKMLALLIAAAMTLPIMGCGVRETTSKTKVEVDGDGNRKTKTETVERTGEPTIDKKVEIKDRNDDTIIKAPGFEVRHD
jgi:hypothetical protein